MVELEIDGQKVAIEEGASIIEAADNAGIYIPRFCYHKKLSIAANCRMCLVEVENVGKAVPACATPVTPDMKVFTQSKKALEAQRAVMQFLLINHPLDCPICDQGGECELQDLAMGFGSPYSYYDESKRAVFNDDLGPLIDTEMTRCILCTRCVRFGEEVAGLRELGVTHRGEHEEITTYVKHMMQSELSGNIIDLCPVGALTAKPSRYTLRGWEVTEHPSIAAHDCVGTNIFIHSRGRQNFPIRHVMRVVPRDNESINEAWMSDRDRFSYEGLHHSDRVLKPRMKKGDRWIEVEWQRALLEIADRTQAIVQQQGADQVAALASPNTTTETLYLLQKMLRSVGSHHIDHRIHESDFSDQQLTPEFPNLGTRIEALENASAILLIGSNIRHEQPMLGHRIYKAYQEGAAIMAVNPMDYPFVFKLSDKIISADVVMGVAEIAKALADHAKKAIAALADIKPSAHAEAIAKTLLEAEHANIILGEFAMAHPYASQLRALARLIGELSGAAMGVATYGANSAGAWLAGAVPHRGPAAAAVDHAGLDAKALLTTDPVRAYFLLNIEPEFDTLYPAQAMKALTDAGLVVCLSTYATETMEAYADFILPIAPYTETAGTFVNIEGTWQSFSAVSPPHGDSKPAWKVIRVLANLMQLDGFNYKTVHEIREELKLKVDQMSSVQSQPTDVPTLKPLADNLRLASWPMYRVDALVRRAQALQDTVPETVASITVNANMAQTLNVMQDDPVTAIQGDSRVTLPLRIDNRLADNIVLLPAGLMQTAGFGEATAAISLEREMK